MLARAARDIPWKHLRIRWRSGTFAYLLSQLFAQLAGLLLRPTTVLNGGFELGLEVRDVAPQPFNGLLKLISSRVKVAHRDAPRTMLALAH